MLAIITGTIKPSSEVKQLIIRDVEDRLKQYVECIHFYIESRAFSKIIFCENSNYGTEEFLELQTFAKKNDISLEILSFQGDADKVKEYGKGYGEGEIMDYVFQNSSLIKESDFLIKITGRLKVINIKQIVQSIKVKNIYFNIPNKVLKEIYDTRLYAMPLNVFQKNFCKAYTEVQDEQGVYLEHVYTKIIETQKIRVKNFPWYPRIKGVSGSSGVIYDYVEWKCMIKDILCKFNYYKVKK